MDGPKSEAPTSLRPAVEDDIPQILEIERRVHVAPWTEENFRAELAKPYCEFLVCTDDETDSVIRGYIIFWFMFEECQILNVATDLPYRGQGYAKQMVRRATTMAIQKGVRKTTLEVRKSNGPAIQLYQALGFSIVHVRKNFYSNGEDAYQMSLPLEGDTLPQL